MMKKRHKQTKIRKNKSKTKKIKEQKLWLWESKQGRKHLTGCWYLVPGADFSLLVIWVRCSFVQLGPQRFGLPVVQSLLQLDVKVPEVLGIQVQLPAQLGKVLLHILAVLRLDEVVEGFVWSVDQILVSHGEGWRLVGPVLCSLGLLLLHCQTGVYSMALKASCPETAVLPQGEVWLWMIKGLPSSLDQRWSTLLSPRRSNPGEVPSTCSPNHGPAALNVAGVFVTCLTE